MIKLENFSYSFPQKDLYDNISFTLEYGQHCAFIGTNGTGKSTLINIIMDHEKYLYDGILEIDPDCRFGYVSQSTQHDELKNITVYEFICDKFIKLQQELDDICTEMETSTDIENLLEIYQNKLDEFDAIGGNTYESIVNKKLNLINLDKHKDLMVSELSGGEFKLVQVLKEMLVNPNLLIMDEPDVFLDFENLCSLKDLINTHKGTLLIITHNRYLLNHCFNKIIHLENKQLQEFDGKYIDYNFSLLQKKIELQELAAADNEEIERNAIMIEKLRATATYTADASRGRSLKARVKIQERLEARRVKEPFIDIKRPNINFTKAAAEIDSESVENDTVLSVCDYSVAYDDLLLDNINFNIGSNDKVALIGANGTGKTTLLRDIYNNCSSTINIAPDTVVSYLSQQQGETLNESNTVMDEFLDLGFNTYTDVRTYVKDFGIEEKILKQRIGDLSGGEKNILQLAKISAFNTDLLLLDEPTSHLDTYSQIALENAINDYKGAVLMISHDYYSIANCMDYVLIIEDKGIRKMTIKKFKRKIYAKHFNRDYLEFDQKKKDLETKIESALDDTNFELAKSLCDKLEELLNTYEMHNC